MSERAVLTLRLPAELYEKSKKIAQKRSKSFTGFLREVLEEKVNEEEKKSMFDAFSLVAEDKEESKVDFAFETQKDVILEE